MSRNGDWMQTYSGRQFWPIDPRPEDLEIEDIAHALSLLCRFNGHCLRFYSVAEHSVLVARLVPAELRLTALLHDASEAYIADVPRPLKPYLPGYKEAEEAVERAVAERYGTAYPMPVEIKRADNAMLAAEASHIMSQPPASWTLPEPAADIGRHWFGWSPERAEDEFLSAFVEFGG